MEIDHLLFVRLSRDDVGAVEPLAVPSDLRSSVVVVQLIKVGQIRADQLGRLLTGLLTARPPLLLHYVGMILL